MDAKPGDIVYVRSTDEPLFILDVRTDFEEDSLINEIKKNFSGIVVIGRRPVLTDKGIQHKVENFLLEELESRQDKEQRIFNETETLRAQMFPKSVSIVEHKN